MEDVFVCKYLYQGQNHGLIHNEMNFSQIWITMFIGHALNESPVPFLNLCPG